MGSPSCQELTSLSAYTDLMTAEHPTVWLYHSLYNQFPTHGHFLIFCYYEQCSYR